MFWVYVVVGYIVGYIFWSLWYMGCNNINDYQGSSTID